MGTGLVNHRDKGGYVAEDVTRWPGNFALEGFETLCQTLNQWGTLDLSQIINASRDQFDPKPEKATGIDITPTALVSFVTTALQPIFRIEARGNIPTIIAPRGALQKVP